jgi:hypothetical protein
MGNNFATELADNDLFPELDLDAFYDEDYNREIDLPNPITWKGNATAPASAIIEQHHLDAWLPESD